MAYDDNKKAKIIADIKAAKLNKTQIAQKWAIARNTLNKIIADHQVKVGVDQEKLNKKIEQEATRKIVEEEAEDLFDYTSKYISNTKILDKANQANLASYIKAIKAAQNEKTEDGKPAPRQLTRTEAETFKISQQFLKLSAETFKINFEGVRLAMGLDKERSDRQLQVNIVNYADADDSL